MKKSFFEKFLSKSGQFTFYKENYEKIIKENKSLKAEIEDKNLIQKDSEDVLNIYKNIEKDIFDNNYLNFKAISIIKEFNLFDYDYYIEKYKINPSINPLLHFIYEGYKLGYNPNFSFDCDFYKEKYPEIYANPFVYYVLKGKKEGKTEINEFYAQKKEIIRKIAENDYSNIKIAIKSPNPVENHRWGDYFFAISMKKEFEKKGFEVVIHEYENWYSNEDGDEDIIIVLRGLREYKTDKKHINLMWNISHPDKILLSEYKKYDIVFISSLKFARKLNKKINTPVKPLLQCTDPDIFYPKKNNKYNEDVLFVGKTRNVYREIIKDILKTNHDFTVYGEGWDTYIDEKYIKGKFIQNNELKEAYSSCKILLNDHWEDMKKEDFPSNRLFDALACETFIISDQIPSTESIFEGNIVTYENSEDLDKKITYYLEHEDERKNKAKKGRELVLKHHTFKNRVESILDALKKL